MLLDGRGRQFDVIVVDEHTRLGRFDSMTAGELFNPLRRAGVTIDIVKDGPVDWESLGGRIIDQIKRETASEEQDTKSRNVINGMLKAAAEGRSLGGKVHYGYRAVVVGTETVKGIVRAKKEIEQDEHQAEVVRFIYERLAQGATLGVLSNELFERGVASPRGSARWSRNGIRKLVTNTYYKGDNPWARQRHGKRYLATKGGAEKRTRQEVRNGLNPEDKWVMRPAKHKAIVSPELWADANQRMRGNQKLTMPIRGGGGFIFSKLLVCGHCGYSMLGRTERGRRAYCCGGFAAYGKDYCHCHKTDEATLLLKVAAALRAYYLNPKKLAKVRDLWRKKAEALCSPRSLAKMEKEIETLRRKVEAGQFRLLDDVPADLRQDAYAGLRRLKEQLAEAEARLTEAKTSRPDLEIEELI